MELKATFKAMSKEEKNGFIPKLREDSRNLDMECNNRNKKDNNEQDGADLQLHN